MEKYLDILKHFTLEGGVVAVEPLGNGLINDTLLVRTDGLSDYVLQRINNAIFKDVDLLQRNIDLVTGHIRRKLLAAGEGDVDRKVLRFLPCAETGKSYWTDGQAFWRVSVFIKDAFTYDLVTPEYSYFAGLGFGRFEAMLSDIPETLGETIPDFHNMELRARQLKEAVAADMAGRLRAAGVGGVAAKEADGEESGFAENGGGAAKEADGEKSVCAENGSVATKEAGVADGSDGTLAEAGEAARPGELASLVSEMLEHMEEMCLAERLHREGKLPKRICHCDTKVNNMLFDAEGKILCIIDLDTVMPSYVFSDFGDFLRTAANPVAEDSPEVEKIDFRMDIFSSFAQGYLESTAGFLTPVERENLPYAACLFPFMQAVRFFTDYLNGDTYYRIAYPEHNLVRTRNQMALWRSAMSKRAEMSAIIRKYA
ncbi:MAG: aminoglycoside phosphotransferase family protein [Bacteroidales bacterium]|nr:aminoglycoside phosphotransferase family protein [Bacteroidales bacterium]